MFSFQSIVFCFVFFIFCLDKWSMKSFKILLFRKVDQKFCKTISKISHKKQTSAINHINLKAINKFKGSFLQFQNSYYLQNTRACTCNYCVHINYFLWGFALNKITRKEIKKIIHVPNLIINCTFYGDQSMPRAKTNRISQVDGNCYRKATSIFWGTYSKGFIHSPTEILGVWGPKHSQHMLRTPSFSLFCFCQGVCFITSSKINYYRWREKLFEISHENLQCSKGNVLNNFLLVYFIRINI